MIKRIIFACLILATPAMAQPARALAQQQPPEMVLLPRAIAEAAAQWVASPNAGNAVQLYAALTACIADNPHDGVTRRMGQDQCAAVTEALAARDKEIADLKPAAAKKPAALAPTAGPAK